MKPEPRLLAETESLATIANRWLATFEKALAGRDDALLKALFHPDSHWRDVLALTWHIRTVNGLEAVLKELKAHAGRAHPTGFRTDPRRTAPRRVTRAGTTRCGRGPCSRRSMKSRDSRNGSAD